jgi:hypothetical protein
VTFVRREYAETGNRDKFTMKTIRILTLTLLLFGEERERERDIEIGAERATHEEQRERKENFNPTPSVNCWIMCFRKLLLTEKLKKKWIHIVALKEYYTAQEINFRSVCGVIECVLKF